MIYSERLYRSLILFEGDRHLSIALTVTLIMNPMPHIPAQSYGFPPVTVMTKTMQDQCCLSLIQGFSLDGRCAVFITENRRGIS